jgi:hypothetical protein
MKRCIGVLTVVGMLAACGTGHDDPGDRQFQRAGSSGHTADLPALVTGTGLVLQPRGGQPGLCLGAVMESFPPQCSGVRLEGWNWDKVDDEEQFSGTTWGSYSVTGTFNGTRLTLTKPPEPPTEVKNADADITTPCAEPEGGWGPGGGQEDIQVANDYAQQRPHYAGLWVDHIDGGSETEDSPVVLTVAFTDKVADYEERLKHLWEGPLCVVRFERTFDELQRIQSELNEGLAELGYGSTFSDIRVTQNKVTFGVVFATDRLREELDERYGPGVVQLEPALVRVD